MSHYEYLSYGIVLFAMGVYFVEASTGRSDTISRVFKWIGIALIVAACTLTVLRLAMP